MLPLQNMLRAQQTLRPNRNTGLLTMRRARLLEIRKLQFTVKETCLKKFLIFILCPKYSKTRV